MHISTPDAPEPDDSWDDATKGQETGGDYDIVSQEEKPLLLICEPHPRHYDDSPQPGLH